MGCGSSNSVKVINVKPVSPNNKNYDGTQSVQPNKTQCQKQDEEDGKESSNETHQQKDDQQKHKVDNDQVEVAKIRDEDNQKYEALDEEFCDTPEHKDWTLFDTFWSEKQSFMNNLNRIEEIDIHALKAPSQLRSNSKKLVEYLTKIAHTDFEKYRAIFRWIANNIRYDTGSTDAESVLKNGYSVCSGYSNLYSHLCRMAGLECQNVYGLAKGADYVPGMDISAPNSPFRHAWNQININGKWYLCDATWATGHPGVEKNGKRHFTFNFLECWFITEPRVFGETHLPLAKPHTKVNVDTEAEIMKPFYETYQEWNNEPLKYPGYFSNHVECISQKLGVINSKSNQVEIVTKVRYAMDAFVTLREIGKNGKETATDLKQYTMHYNREDFLVVNARLPRKGSYLLTICGKPHGMSKEDSGATDSRLISFKIVETGVEKVSPFPVSNGLGQSWRFKLNGLEAAIPSPFIEAKNGKTSIEIVCKNGILPMLCSLYHENDDKHDNLSSCTYGEVQNQKRVRFHIRCPKSGNYVFKIFVKFGDTKTYEQSAVFVISCSGPGSKEKFPSDNSVLWGRNDFMTELGIKTFSPCSTITTENNGETLFRLKLPRGIAILFNLFDIKGNDVGQYWLCAETSNDTDGSKLVNIIIRCPNVGKYRLMLFGNHDNISTKHYLGRWLVECDAPCDGQMFPENRNLWGTNPHFDMLGLTVVLPESSTIRTKKGQTALTLKCTRKDYRANKFTHSLLVDGKPARHEKRSVMAEIVNDGDDVIITYHFRLLVKGFHHFKLWGNPKTMNNNSFAGQWLIICDEPESDDHLFPEHFGPWGPVEKFDALNLQVHEPKSSTIYTSDGKCSLVIKSQKPVNTTYKLSGKNNSIHQSAVHVMKEERDGQYLYVIKFDIPHIGAGYYGFDLWAQSGKNQGEFIYVGKWLIYFDEN